MINLWVEIIPRDPTIERILQGTRKKPNELIEIEYSNDFDGGAAGGKILWDLLGSLRILMDIYLFGGGRGEGVLGTPSVDMELFAIECDVCNVTGQLFPAGSENGTVPFPVINRSASYLLFDVYSVFISILMRLIIKLTNANPHT